MNNNSEYIKIDLMKIVEGILHRLWIVIIAMLVGGASLFSYATFFVTPLYQAKALMYVNNSSFSVGTTSVSFSSSQITAAKSLVETYLVILTSRLTLNDVIARGELDYSYEQLTGMISAEAVNDTEVFSVTVTCPDPYEAEHIANTIAQVLPDKIDDIIEGSSVRIVDYAVVPAGKVSPSIPKYTVLGLMAGMLVSCVAIAFIEIVDDQIHSESYLLENYKDIPLLTVVPDLLEEKSHKGYYYYKRGYHYGYRHHDYENKEHKHEDKTEAGSKSGRSGKRRSNK